jgi:hypothetical protein
MLTSDERFAVPTLVWGYFLRLATNRRIFEVPTPRPEAFASSMPLAISRCISASVPGHATSRCYAALCDEADASGDLIADAVIAAVAVEHGCQVVTLDRDFARFSSVEHTRPSLRE